MCIKDEIKVMDDTKTTGNIIEWSGFKAQIFKIIFEVESLRVKSACQARKIESLEHQLNNYKKGKDTNDT